MANEDINYNLLLDFYIDRLPSYDFKTGAEGRAFFVDDDFVVKHISCAKDSNRARDFYKHCEEVRNFHKMGCILPKYYAYTIKESKTNPENVDMYILIERMPGEELFFTSLEAAYESLFYPICSKEEYTSTIYYNKNLHLEAKIYKKFLDSILESNLKFEAMSDSEIENFIKTDYIMTLGQTYAFTDINSGNVLISESKLSLIDPSLPEWVARYQKMATGERVFFDILYLYLVNKDVFHCANRARNFSDLKYQIMGAKEEILALSEKNILRLIKKLNEMYKPVVTNKLLKSQIEDYAKNAVGLNRMKSVLIEIEMGE